MNFREYLGESKEDMYYKEIARLSGTRASAVKAFIEDNELSAYDLMQALGQKKTSGQDVMASIAGKAGNKIQTALIKQFAINEAKKTTVAALKKFLTKNLNGIEYAEVDYKKLQEKRTNRLLGYEVTITVQKETLRFDDEAEFNEFVLDNRRLTKRYKEKYGASTYSEWVSYVEKTNKDLGKKVADVAKKLGTAGFDGTGFKENDKSLFKTFNFLTGPEYNTEYKL